LQFFKKNFAALLLMFMPVVVAAQTPANNLQFTLQLFDRIALRAANEISGDGGTAIWVKPPASAKPEERFLFSRLVTILNDSLHLPVFTDPADTLRTQALTYRLPRCEIIYQALPRRRFWQRARWRRLAKVMIEIGSRETATGQVYFQKIFEESRTDTLAEKTLPGLEDQNFPFTIGRKENRESGSRWLEPVLITSATGVVVYLFYSLRSR
jgi:hypothetical protein